MAEEEKVDLSPLDPARDPERWNRMVQSVASRALSAHQAKNTLAHQLSAWGRPALAAAAALAIVSWALAWSTERPATQARAESTAPALQLASWAAGGELPETPEMLSVLGGSNE